MKIFPKFLVHIGSNGFAELERLCVKDFRKTLTKSVLSQHPWSPKYGCKFRYLLCHSLKLLFHSNPQVVHLASQTPSKKSHVK